MDTLYSVLCVNADERQFPNFFLNILLCYLAVLMEAIDTKEPHSNYLYL